MNNFLDISQTSDISVDTEIDVMHTTSSPQTSGVVSSEDPYYPPILKLNTGFPKNLYYKGNYNLDLFQNCISIVGSRNITSYGIKVIEYIISNLSGLKVSIVSGFMNGVDYYAHKLALNFGIPTIAVLPCGIDHIHPDSNRSLYEQILSSNSLIISEYASDFNPQIWTYPRRNRIVAGLSNITIVVEARENSGSLITASFAKKYNRHVFAVPCNLFSPNSKGIFELLSNGANVFSCIEDILPYINSSPTRGSSAYVIPTSSLLSNKDASPATSNPRTHSSVKKSFLSCMLVASQSLSSEAIRILQILSKTPLSFDDLCNSTNIPVSDLNTHLSNLLLDGYIFEEANILYAN